METKRNQGVSSLSQATRSAFVKDVRRQQRSRIMVLCCARSIEALLTVVNVTLSQAIADRESHRGLCWKHTLAEGCQNHEKSIGNQPEAEILRISQAVVSSGSSLWNLQSGNSRSHQRQLQTGKLNPDSDEQRASAYFAGSPEKGHSKECSKDSRA